MTLPQIKHRFTGKVLYTGESGMKTRQMLEKATASKADLSWANLSEANLSWANLSWANLSRAELSGANLSRAELSGANLSRANLSRANLSGANLSWANLSGAELSGANLSWANLSWANLSGAKFGDKTLIGTRPYFQIGPIGSRCANLTLWLTDQGPVLKTGCFTGSFDEFRASLAETHSDNDHAKEYEMALLMCEAHAALWMSKEGQA